MDDRERIVRDEVVTTWRRAPLGELLWRDPDGRPGAMAAVPLVDDGVPCVALPYRDLEPARRLAAATEVRLGVTAVRADGAPAVLAHTQVEVHEDPDGLEFQRRGLLEQELSKHPPSRRRLDSLLLRREHWWFLPRLLVHLRGVDEARAVAPGDALLVLGGDTLSVSPCGLEERDPLRLRRDDTSPPATVVDPRPGLVFEHGADVPDLEGAWQRRWHGTWHEDGLHVVAIDGAGPTAGPATLRQRLRAESELAKACKRALDASTRGPDASRRD